MTGVKIRLRSGSREIELEGPRADVDALLERWWSGEDSPEGGDNTSAMDGSRSSRTNRASRRKPKKNEAAPKSGDAASFDAQALVNRMREEADYSLFEQKVLHQKDSLNKLRLVCWYSGAELTTGEMAKILHALGVKIDASNVWSCGAGAIALRHMGGGRPVDSAANGWPTIRPLAFVPELPWAGCALYTNRYNDLETTAIRR